MEQVDDVYEKASPLIYRASWREKNINKKTWAGHGAGGKKN